MADVRFLFRCEFRKRLAERREEEKRIVAETVRSPRLMKDDAARTPFERRDGLAFARGGNDADETCRALVIGNVRKFTKEACVVFVVWGIFVDASFERGVPGREDAGSAAECVHCESRIVGDDDPTGREPAVVLGFFSSIAVEAVGVFSRRGRRGEIWQAANLNAVRTRCAGEVAQLAGI